MYLIKLNYISLLTLLRTDYEQGYAQNDWERLSCGEKEENRLKGLLTLCIGVEEPPVGWVEREEKEKMSGCSEPGTVPFAGNKKKIFKNYIF